MLEKLYFFLRPIGQIRSAPFFRVYRFPSVGLEERKVQKSECRISSRIRPRNVNLKISPLNRPAGNGIAQVGKHSFGSIEPSTRRRRPAKPLQGNVMNFEFAGGRPLGRAGHDPRLGKERWGRCGHRPLLS
jgi:hypothetical protein